MKLSIITINKDNAEGLQKTLDSVACQTWHDFEHIIVDGASADSSVDIIRNYAADVHPYPVKWLSEPDTGIYNAMNKGIRMANGEYCLFLNSGDYLYAENVLESVFDKKCKSDIFYGNYYTSSGDLRSGCIEEEVTCFTFFDYSIHHSGCSFIKKEIILPIMSLLDIFFSTSSSVFLANGLINITYNLPSINKISIKYILYIIFYRK